MADERQLPSLSSRQEDILSCIVQAYSEKPEPVGSRHLVENYQLNISSATVRNEMAQLEEMGYIVAPYTSAGRVPTAGRFPLLCATLAADAQPDERRAESYIGACRQSAVGHGTVDAADGRPAGALGAIRIDCDTANLPDEFLQTCRVDRDSGSAGANGAGIK